MGALRAAADRAVQTWLRGAPPGKPKASFVLACEQFPYCSFTPAPPSLTPPPWRIRAPEPNPVFPSLGVQERFMPWEKDAVASYMAHRTHKQVGSPLAAACFAYLPVNDDGALAAPCLEGVHRSH